ncbi:hypothetical protein PACTADRAFT_66608 [Pachysolen tannophilus NRRL Y-2460]|uniref:FAD dependent oxidoreductase domain-containing protein n=1 Tax=Pachysolen tannophilus NRRL Y-2460 TaxID=669874 RepID=A0A1E4TVS3_PACTA|nr:hypothetical protein PACTADRAFT_66608 [Pachysolen tannophilus NRRL Y-2460]
MPETTAKQPTPEYQAYSSFASGKHKGKKHIIIVGAGIIGVCTAFYLTRHPNFDPKTHHITIIESKRVAGGASGKAGGLLALWAFPQQIVPLSFKLHNDLSDEFGGEKEWGYRRLTTISLEGDISSTNTAKELLTQEVTSPKSIPMNQEKNSIRIENASEQFPQLPADLNWINPGIIKEWNHLGNESTTAQVHPYQFTTFILRKCIETGAVELIIGKVDDILFDEETSECNGVSYYPSSTKATYDKIDQSKLELHGDHIVLTIGPWTSKILPDCPISGLRAHSITVAPQDSTKVSPYAIFTELKMSKTKFVSPEMYARKDEVYICGEGDTSVPIPETTDDVEIVAEKCDELFKYVSRVSTNLGLGKILKRQACYLPVLDIPSSSGPLIGETNVKNLYLASGHSCWGINNAPATGLLMSELLLDGKAQSCDISALDPSLYFDASLIYDSEYSSSAEAAAEEEEDDEDEDEDEEDEEEEEEGDNVYTQDN